ncbi:unnamed protein product [Schistosoma turkestanicum]|nr:unnamed protein product [Schistosoma turkestanicum]
MDFHAPEVSPQTNSIYGLTALIIITITYFLWKFFRSRPANSPIDSESRRLAVEAARARFQAEVDAEVAQKKAKYQDEGEGKSSVRESNHSGEKKKRLRPDDYNPLMGDTGRTYRPTSRFCSTGG